MEEDGWQEKTEAEIKMERLSESSGWDGKMKQNLWRSNKVKKTEIN